MVSQGSKAAVSIMSLLMLSFAFPQSARGEGSIDFNGAWGVNRVIRTKQGYTEVAGRAYIDYWFPTETDGNQEAITQRTNPYDDTPSAYFGGRGVFNDSSGDSVEVDGGIQLETQVWRGAQDTRNIRGWGAFISNSQHARIHAAAVGADPTRTDDRYTNPRVWTPLLDASGNVIGGDWNFWRNPSWAGGVNWTGATGYTTVNMTYGITGSGGAKLTISEFARASNPEDNTFYWNRASRFEQNRLTAADAINGGHLVSPWISEHIFNTAQNGSADVKRVVAMTRANADAQGNPPSNGSTPANAELDGSWMVCDFSLGQVRPYNVSSFKTWEASDVLQREADGTSGRERGTGYDAPGDFTSPGYINPAAWDRRWPWNLQPGAGDRATTASRTIVEFLPVGNRETDTNFNFSMRSTTQSSNNDSRYANETVRINLRTATRPVGQALAFDTSP